MMYSVSRFSRLALILTLGGCASLHTGNPEDPIEPVNRAIFRFNDTFDKVALKPVATAYRSWLPSFVQTGVNNFFGNISDVWSAFNGFLQGNIADGSSDVMRVAVNSTFGLGGLLDIGSAAGLQKHNKDFGQTLGKWGVGPGPYLVLPILGPSNLRDAVSTRVDVYGDLWSYKYPVRWRNTGTVVRVIDIRANLLDAGNMLDAAALDKYVFMRNAYMQRRQSQIHGDSDEEAE